MPEAEPLLSEQVKENLDPSLSVAQPASNVMVCTKMLWHNTNENFLALGGENRSCSECAAIWCCPICSSAGAHFDGATTPDVSDATLLPAAANGRLSNCPYDSHSGRSWDVRCPSILHVCTTNIGAHVFRAGAILHTPVGHLPSIGSLVCTTAGRHFQPLPAQWGFNATPNAEPECPASISAK